MSTPVTIADPISRPRHSLRDARPDDVPRLLELESLFPGDRLSSRQFRHHLASPAARLRVVLSEAQIAGYALILLRRDSKVARLYSMVVDPGFRRLGLAAVLLADACRQATLCGRERLRLEVRADNAAAIALYRREGWVEFGRHRAYYEDGCDALRFELRLGPNGERC
ncbi:GNAT family N-acetyltransferase [Xanthomonadaceae bacterium JHOS43]|nr:GNAT family N-acetyltransferase [Xanthomonadaceae bacterium JHOS43]